MSLHLLANFHFLIHHQTLLSEITYDTPAALQDFCGFQNNVAKILTYSFFFTQIFPPREAEDLTDPFWWLCLWNLSRGSKAV